MQSSNPKISIIVPLYNEEKDLERCLNSVLAQTFTDFECILVDDKSTDSSPQICDKYAETDKRFKVVHKIKNEGLPKARKTGLDNAIADFIIHCDSDDWLEPNALYLLYEKQKATNANIVRTAMIYHIKDKTTHSKLIIEYDHLIDPLVWFLLNLTNTLCGTLYKKDLFTDYIVPEIFAGEDGVTNIQIFSRIKSDEFCHLELPVYNYDCKNSSPKKIYNTHSTTWENPYYKSKLYIRELIIKSGKGTNEVLSAFSFYMILSYIIPYLRNHKKTKKKEIKHFYNEYWKNCEHIYLMRKPERNIIPLFNFSILLGNIYISNFIFIIFTKIDYFCSRTKSEGIIGSLKYYFTKYFISHFK
jgi:glycosyltransferase involved in cell wall biosynthesis